MWSRIAFVSHAQLFVGEILGLDLCLVCIEPLLKTSERYILERRKLSLLV